MHGVEELRASEDAARLAGKRRQDLEFGGGEVDRTALPIDAHPRNVEGDARRADYVTGLLGPIAPPEDCSYASNKLPGAERLRDVVVGPELETDQLVDLIIPSGQHHDRQARVAPDRSRDIEPVELGQRKIEDHE